MTSRTAHSMLVGRASEIAAIVEAVRLAFRGTLQLVQVEGEAGIGKTSVVTHALADPTVGRSPWVARFGEMEQARTFGPLAAALHCVSATDDPRRASIASAISAIAPAAADPSEHFRVADAIVDLMEEEVLAHPRILVLEDLHWADAGSLYAISLAVRRLALLPMVIVATMRPAPRSHAMRAVLRVFDAHGSTLVALRGLDDEAVGAMAARALGPELAARLGRRLAATAGNPLFVSELLECLLQEPDWDVGAADLPHGLRLTILRRISFLSDAALDLLRQCSVLGVSFSATDISTVTRRQLPDLLPAITECLASEVLREEDDRLRFRHELIREALYYEIPATVRRELHAEVARRLDAAGAPPGRVAEHVMLGAPAGDQGAIDALRRAAAEAAQAPERRVELLRMAAGLHPPADPSAVETQAALAHALMLAGSTDEAIDTADRLLRRDPGAAIASRMRILISRALRVRARWRQLIDATDGWLGLNLDDEERGLHLTLRANAVRGLQLDPEAALRDCGEALEIADRIDSDEVRVAAFTTLESVYRFAGRPQEGADAARRAVDIVERNDSPQLKIYHPQLWLGQGYMFTGRFAEAEAALTAGLRSRESAGTAWDLSAYQVLLALVLFKVGRWDEAVSAAEAGLDAPHWANTTETAHALLAAIAAQRGQLEEARAHAAAAVLHRGETTYTAQTTDLILAIAADDRAAAKASIAQVLEPTAGSDILDTDELVSVTGFLLAGGERDLAGRLVELFQSWLTPEVNVVPRACIEGAAAVLADDAAACESALAQLKAAGVWAEAPLAEQTGLIYARRGDLEAAVRHFTRARGWYEHLDASLCLARLSQTMRACGIRLGARGRRRRPRSGWASLTDAERRVLDLAAAGLTNPQIADRLYLSRYTVQAHLKSIFQKLGISSRVELAARRAARD